MCCSQSYSISQYYYQLYIIMKFTAAIAIAAVSGANAYSFSGTSLKATTNNGANMQMSTGMGVNGFGRIGRLVTRIMMEDDDIKLSAINAGSATTDYSKCYSVRFVHIINVLMLVHIFFKYVYKKNNMISFTIAILILYFHLYYYYSGLPIQVRFHPRNCQGNC